MANEIFSDPEMQEIFEGYLIETDELLDSLSQDLMTLENTPNDLELLNSIFREIHTIKGTSSFMGFESIVTIAHHAEDLLNQLRKDELKVTLSIIDVLLEVHDLIRMLVNMIKEKGECSLDFDEIIERIEKLRNGEGQNSVLTEEDIVSKANSNQNATPSINESLNLTRNESVNSKEIPDSDKDQMIKSEVAHSDSALDQVLSNEYEMLQKQGDFTVDEISMIEEAFAEVNRSFSKNRSESVGEQKTYIDSDRTMDEESNNVVVSSNSPNKIADNTKLSKDKDQDSVQHVSQSLTPKNGNIKINTETIRVDVNRVEALMDLSGELVLGRNRLAQLTNIIEREFNDKDRVKELIEATSHVDFITSEIQSAIMRMRMVPIGKLYQKAPRIVRDLSKEFGKKIVLIVKGEETEIDRGIIEELNDPLVHMIRNSCDHGIETVEDRIKLGKPEVGTITLDAEQEGNTIVLKISDDGKGMDPEKLKTNAIMKGLITDEQSQSMSRREIFQLIFAPGFSTATRVSNVSGRGVGMDVVRTNIQNLKGLIEIESEVGKGSTFIIKLPLTLAIIQGLLIKLKTETYALPLNSVVSVVSVDNENISSVNRQEVIRIREEIIPLLRLDKALGLTDVNQNLVGKYVVVVGIGMKRVGLVVDELLGQQEIVIKSLGEYLGNIKSIAGSTILGDGKVILIIDIAELVENSIQNRSKMIKN